MAGKSTGAWRASFFLSARARLHSPSKQLFLPVDTAAGRDRVDEDGTHLGYTAEIGWVSDDPHLSGNFAPIGREVNVADLPVVAGRIPEDLSGVYMRNGPNPLFKPLS